MMKHRVKRIVRQFSLWLKNRTRKWVMPSTIEYYAKNKFSIKKYIQK